MLQRVVLLLERQPELDVGSAAKQVELAFRRLYDLLDGRGEPNEALAATLAAVDAARGSLTADAGPVEQARGLLDQLRMALGQATLPAIGATEPEHHPALASLELPRLQQQARPSLGPKLRIAPAEATEAAAFEPLPPPTTHEELETYGQRQREHIEAHLAAVKAAPPVAESEDENEDASAAAAAPFVSKWARECFDEVAMLGDQRQPLLGDDWRTTRDIEERLLWTLDAFASLGPQALQQVETLVLDAPAPDPLRTFAAGLLLGCVAGRDTLGLAERIARAQAADPAALRCFGDALLLAPHPNVTTLLRSWLGESDPDYRAAATRVLAARGLLTETELSACAQDRPEIAALVLVPMALTAHPDLDQLLPSALESPRRRLRLAAWQALALTSRRDAVALLGQHLSGELGDEAALLLAALGSRNDANVITQRALHAPTAEALEAVALSGHIGAVEGLIGLLRGDEDVALGAARALERITGAGLLADVEIEAEKLDPPELPEQDTGGFEGPPAQPLSQLVSNPRFMPAEPDPDVLELPAPDPDLWAAWWSEHRDDFPADRRHRSGQLYTPLVAHAELAGPLLTRGERRHVGIELRALSKQDHGFDVGAFVVQQEQTLERWQAELAALSSNPGAWVS